MKYKSVIIIFLLSLFYSSLSHSKQWHDNVQQFYKNAVQDIFRIAVQKQQKKIVLLPEINKTNYFVSSPCNIELSKELFKMSKNNNYFINIFFWDGDIAANSGFSGTILLNGKKCLSNESTISPIGKWYTIKDKDEYEREYITNPPSESLMIRLIIETLIIDKKEKIAKTTFRIVENKGKEIIKFENNFSTNQIKFFVNKKPTPYLFYFFIVSLLILIIIFFSSCIRYLIYKGQIFKPKQYLSLIICFAGFLIPFFFNYINGFNRKIVNYEEYVLIFIIDDNSEIIFLRTNENEKNSYDIKYIINQIINDTVTYYDTIGSQRKIKTNFCSWIYYRLVDLVRGDKIFTLNVDYGAYIHKVSGMDFGKNRRLPVLWQDYTTNKTINKKKVREPRLIIPAEELEWIKLNNPKFPAHTKKIILFFTSASASCLKDVESYNKRINKYKNYKMPKVFSIFIPTIPKTGENNIYDFEEGKIDLLHRVSNYIININKSPKNKQSENEISIPIFHHNDLNIKNRNKWDKAQNLDIKRNEYFLISQEKKDIISNKSKEIINLFDKFYKQNFFEETNSLKYSINTLAINSFSINFLSLFIITIISLTIALIISYLQYNKTSLFYWIHSSWYRWTEYLLTGFSYILLLLSFVYFVYQVDNIHDIAYIGNIQFAYILTGMVWTAFFLGPFLIFKFHYIGKTWIINPINSLSLSWLKSLIVTGCIIALSLSGFYIIPFKIASDSIYIFFVFIWIFCPYILLLLLDIIGFPKKIIFWNITINPEPAPLVWWKIPINIFLIKLILALTLLTVIHGSDSFNLSWNIPIDIWFVDISFIIGIFWILIAFFIWIKKGVSNG